MPGAWPQAVQGRPATFQAGDDGVYLWHDPDGGWALRATHSGPHDRVIIAGTLHTDGRFVFVHRVRDEGNDIVAVSANHRTILFRFVNYGWVDGLDFATHCSTGFSASFYIAGTLAPTGAVHLGANEVNPTSNPVRRRADASARLRRGRPAHHHDDHADRSDPYCRRLTYPSPNLHVVQQNRRRTKLAAPRERRRLESSGVLEAVPGHGPSPAALVSGRPAFQRT